MLFALQNTSDQPVDVATFLYLGGRQVRGQQVALAGNSSRLVELRQLLPASESAAALPETGAVRFVALSTEGYLEGRTVAYDEKTGFSVLLAMHAPMEHRSNQLELPAALVGQPDKQLGFPVQTRFATQLLLTNTTVNKLEVVATLHGRDSAGAQIAWEAPAIALRAYESRVISLRDAHSQSGLADGYIGLRLTHNGKLMDLLAEAVTLDQTRSLSFYTRFHDRKLLGHSLHNVSFDLAGNKNTLLVLRNVSDQPVGYGYQINYQEGDSFRRYLSPLQELGAQEIKVIDLKALRDDGVPDAEGGRLPKTASFGNLTIFSQQRALIVSEPTFDFVNGLSDTTATDVEWDNCLACLDLCRACCDGAMLACYGVLTTCESAAAVALTGGLNNCENNAFCQSANPNYNEEECNRCKDAVWQTYAIAAGACVGGFYICFEARDFICAGRNTPDPANPDNCVPCTGC